MVLKSLRPDKAPAFIAPDEQTWTLAGDDPAARGLRPVFAPGHARVALIAERMPEPLVEGVADWLERMPAAAHVETIELAGLPGGHGAASQHGDHQEHHHEAEGHGGHDHGSHGQADHDQHGHGHGGHDHGGHDHGGHDHGGHDHGGHDHHDMMAIVGDPSADGLVMEPIEFRFGPVGTPLPAGLAVDITLDGDVVAEARIDATLRRATEEAPVPAAPDLLAPVAWRTLLDGIAGDRSEADRWTGIAAVEVERAVSHLAWLRSFGRLLGWARLIERCTVALAATAEGRLALSASSGRSAAAADALGPATRAVLEVADLIHGSRSLRLRTAHRAVVTADDIRHHELHGPTARASGVEDDARSEHPLYRRLEFAAVMRSDGDSLARTSVRAEETVQSLRIAEGALRAAAAWKPADAEGDADATLEGPRGPLQAVRSDGMWSLTAPGERAAREVAARTMIGLEWSTALVAAASFDLSPWSVGE